ncbi:MAG: GNAT family N-acetyltransferase [Bacteroidota bacterium]
MDQTFLIRPARIQDVTTIQHIRRSVRENRLSDPLSVTDADCARMLQLQGEGWVAEAQGQLVGFSIVDYQDHNVWALFLLPEFEGQGIGKALLDQLMRTYFSRHQEALWLSTTPGTRAEGFYRKLGWQEVGPFGEEEIKFEFYRDHWLALSHSSHE